MKLVLQRVTRASVSVGGAQVSAIGRGFLALVGVQIGDTPEDAVYLARKTAGLRVFSDVAGKMNLGLADVNGEVLAVSQFTLLADTRGGRRPSFSRAAQPQDARRLYAAYVRCLTVEGVFVSEGVFQADMQVNLTNDGPVTIIIDSVERLAPNR